MASVIYEFFGFRPEDNSLNALEASSNSTCPILKATCEKTLSDGTVSGVCSIKPITTSPVICCPIRLYSENYKLLSSITNLAFGEELPLVPGRNAVAKAKSNNSSVVAVFGKRWGGELRLPQKLGRGGYFVDWVLAKLSKKGVLEEFVAVEIQTIDTTGNYRNGINGLRNKRTVEKTTAGLNWENVSKRILPQIIYKAQVLQREELCKKGLFFVTPEPVFKKIMDRLGGQEQLPKYSLQPAAVSFITYDYDFTIKEILGEMLPLKVSSSHSTVISKLQEAFNNVTLKEENVYRDAILKALEGK